MRKISAGPKKKKESCFEGKSEPVHHNGFYSCFWCGNMHTIKLRNLNFLLKLGLREADKLTLLFMPPKIERV